MACTIVARLLHFRQRPSAPSSFAVLGCRPDSSSRESINFSISQPPTHPDSDLHIWGMMAGQGSTTLAIKNLPRNVNLDLLSREFHGFDGFVQSRLVETGEPTVVAFVDFSTSADAAKALAAKEIVMVNSQLYTTVYADDNISNLPQTLDTDISPPRKRLKTAYKTESRLLCQICTSVIEGLYSKPCRQCKGLWCFDCVKTMFIGATHDHERMPAKCCRRVLHHGVAGGILDTAELEIYKQRYDEFCTSNPMYCPVPTCSTFIPPRLMHPVDSKISCHICTMSICVKCKQATETDHQCAPTDSNIAKIKNLNYKLCPKCGTGVMKMYGCPHIRCNCGAHFCYDCRRSINSCYKRPCRAAREDGQYSEYESDNESEIGDEAADAEQAAALSAMPQWPADLVGNQPSEATSVAEQPVGLNVQDDTTVEFYDAHSQLQTTALEQSNPLNWDPPGDGQMNQVQQDLQLAWIPSAEPDVTAPAVAPIGPQPDMLGAVMLEDSNREDESSLPQVTATPATQISIDNLAPVSLSIALPPSETQEAAPVDENINLDDPETNDWEVESLDFGEEPEDESWDVWGCEHRFRELRKDMVDKCWMRDTEKYLDCMKCFERILLHEKDVAESARGRKGKGKGKVSEKTVNAGEKKGDVAGVIESFEGKTGMDKAKLAHDCYHCGIVVCSSCKDEFRRKKKREIKAARRLEEERE